MKLQLHRASQEETAAVLAFYAALMADMERTGYHTNWNPEIYPDRRYLSEAVRAGECYLASDGDEIVGAMILNQSTNEGYAEARWQVAAAPEEIAVIHALGAALSRARQGIGTFLVREAMRIASAEGRRAIRLDVFCGNLPAERMYRNLGFRYISRVAVEYEYTGHCEFDLYEYLLP